jgi:hypothetical protein
MSSTTAEVQDDNAPPAAGQLDDRKGHALQLLTLSF